MTFTQEQLRQMEERVEATKGKKLRPAVVPISVEPVLAPATQVLDVASVLFIQPDGYRLVEFTYQGELMPKPRMTRRDKFFKRPCVERYWAFADGLRAAAGSLEQRPDIVISTVWVPMPSSWSEKKKAQMAGFPCREVFDVDNFLKGIFDALFKQDKCIWFGATLKYWCQSGQERVNVKILYAKSS
jgi:Holliday junction resolvase RusA-like endonuclease